MPDRPDILFLHGGHFDGTMWSEVAAALAGARCHAPDLPGHGPRRAETFTTLEAAADDVADRVRGPRAPDLVVGLSLGGYVALTLAARHPALVPRLLVSGVHAGSMPRRRAMRLAMRAALPFMRIAAVRRLAARMMGAPDGRVIDAPDGSSRVTLATLRALAEAVIDFDGREALPRIAAPCLLLAGEREQAFVRRALPTIRDSMPDCEARIVRGQGHAWNLSAPDLFAETVRAWLTGAALPETLAKPGEDAL